MTTTPLAPTAAPGTTLAAGTRLGAVHLTVSDLDRSVAFYQDAIGLEVHERDDGRAALGAGAEDLVVLVEEPGARPAGRHAGLYHFALLHPSREALAHALARLALTRTPIEGASDHGVSEAIYLPDPDGNGIELYADRPREAWPRPRGGERVAMFTRALDLDALLGLVAGQQPRRRAARELVMGHVHLHVGDLEAARRFYRDVIGFEEMTSLPNAAFVSAGGYHHHLAFNTWRGVGVPPARAGTVGLRHWTVVLDGEQELAALRARAGADDRDGELLLRDPSGNAVRLVAERRTAASPRPRTAG